MKLRSSRLMALFSGTSAGALLAILVLSYLGTGAIYQHNILTLAQGQSVQLGRSLLRQERGSLSGCSVPGGALCVSAQDYARLDERMGDYLAPLNIVKIKVFDPQFRIIYSTDRRLVGRVDSDNGQLAAALGGETVSEIATEARLRDLDGDTHRDLEVVETYVPAQDAQGRVIGAFEVYLATSHFRAGLASVQGSSLALMTLILLAAFGVQFLIMRRSARQLQVYEGQLHALASVDALTGLANRRAVLKRADEEFSRVHRPGPSAAPAPRSTCFLLVDVDNFKAINDAHGHQAGDAVLKRLAERLAAAVRTYDVVGRFGGEEFLVVAPQCDLAAGRHLAGRIRCLVRQRPFVVAGTALQVTVSIGLACTRASDVSIEETIQRADTALYEAKGSGRDRVHEADQHQPAPC